MCDYSIQNMDMYEVIKAYTIPIDKIKSKVPPVFPKPYGSGVLVTYEGEYFLFSAGHVFSGVDISYLGVNLPDGFTPFIGHCNFMPTDRDKDHPNNRADVAVLRLETRFAQDIGRFYRYLPIDNVAIGNVIPVTNKYYILGYPASRFRINPKTNTAAIREFRFVTKIEMDFRKWHRLNKDKKTNYLLKFCRKHVTRLSDGKKIWAPIPYGISGCGLWVEKDGQPLLIGIMNEYSLKESVMIGTRTDYYTEVVRAMGYNTIRKSPLKIKMQLNKQ